MPPQPASRPMTQNCTGTARKDCGHPLPLKTEQRMANGIDTQMDRVKGPSFETTSNSAPTNARTNQLNSSNNPMLSLGQRRDHLIDATRRASGPYEVLDAHLVPHAPDSGTPRRACGALIRVSLQHKRDSSPPVPPLALIP